MLFQGSLFDKARASHLVRVVLDIDVPEIRQLGKQGEHFPSFSIGFAFALVSGKAHRHGATVAHRFLGLLNQLAHQAHAIDKCPPVLVRTLVGERRQKL